jgi:hypothetical protein
VRDPDEIIRTFEKIESKVNVDELLYKGLNIWPVIRLKLGFDLLYDRPPLQPLQSREYSGFSILRVPYLWIKIRYYKLRFLAKIPPLKEPNWFFAFDRAVFVDQAEGKKYSRYIDPYYEFFSSKEIPATRITFRTLQEGPCTGDEYYHQAEVVMFDYLQRNYFCRQQVRKMTGSDKEDLAVVEGIVSQIVPLLGEADRKYVTMAYYDVFEEVMSYKYCFAKLFSKRRPSRIFFECFYSEMKMAMIAAANYYGINTIELQHGAIENFMYLPYKRDITKQNLLPKLFWCWSGNDVQTISGTNGQAGRLRPVRLGNLWFRKNRNAGQAIPPDTYNEKKRNFRKVILITLQHQIGYQEIFLELVKAAPADFLFLLRYHPLMSEEEKRSYDALSDHANVDVECNNILNLYQCFNLADIHLTHSSTTATEALNFKINTVLVDRIGYIYFRKLVDNGVLLFSDDANGIIQLINNSGVSSVSNDYLIDIPEPELLAGLNKILA